MAKRKLEGQTRGMICLDPRRSKFITTSQYEYYLKMCRENDAFDLRGCRGCLYDGVRQVRRADTLGVAEKAAQFAVKTYNEENKITASLLPPPSQQEEVATTTGCNKKSNQPSRKSSTMSPRKSSKKASGVKCGMKR